jgi:Cu+-exporting ATPase
VEALLEAEFEVDSIALRDGAQAVDPDFTFEHRESMLLFPEARGWLEEARKLVRGVVQRSAHKQGYRHLLNCEACQREVSETSVIAHSGTAATSARISSGHNSVKDLEKAEPTVKIDDQLSQKNDLPSWQNTYEALISIGGMTCSVCTGKVAETLQAIDWVKDASVNLMSNSGLVVFEAAGDGAEEAARLVDEIESIGYDAALDRMTNLTPPTDAGNPSSGDRRAALLVKGMYCQTCTEKIVAALDTAFGDTVKIEAEPTVHSPVLRIRYTPCLTGVTIRKIICALSAIDPAFEVSVFHPPTIEERSRQIQLKERNNYLIRLCFAFICAIPTFLIGVVWMALVPSSDPMRIYMETAVWVGNVPRIEWALLIISTPVMFYAANPFHMRAMKEIMALWRRGSPVPVLRRFYRFGSMNLLISLGVSISYFSSVAMLVLAARKDPNHPGMSKGHTATYFDSTVFLTMFLLMGESSVFSTHHVSFSDANLDRSIP